MRFCLAILLSLLLHLLLAVALAGLLAVLPSPDSLVQLDLSSVEMSFADEEDDAAALQPLVSPALDAPAPTVEPPALERPPEAEPLSELPPEMDALKLPDPAEARPTLKTPEPPPKPRKPERPVRPPSVATSPVPTVAPRQARVDAPAKLPQNFKMPYPEGARRRNEQGLVLLELVVSKRGVVEKATVVTSSGFPELDAAALKKARALRLTPARSDGKPVSSTTRLPINFKLTN